LTPPRWAPPTAFSSSETIIRTIIRRTPWVALALFGLTRMACATPLEDLFNGPDKPRFFSEASAAADAGDPEALFLLGKAYHLGMGVGADQPRARELYGRARAQGSGWASHHLGLMALNDGRRGEAIVLLDEALARGVQMPTLHDLGRAHAPEDPTTRFALREPVAAAGRAGDYFARAYAVQSEGEEAFAASRQYLRAWQMARLARGEEATAFDLPALRERAVRWLRIGMDRDHAPSWTNYGVLLYEEGHLDEARAAFEHAAPRGIAVAHYYLAKLDTSRSESALIHLEQAALLGLADARDPAVRQLADRLQYERDLPTLTRGADRMAALLALGHDYPGVMQQIEQRLAWGRYLEEVRAQAAPLPKRPLHLRECGLSQGTPWRLVAYKSLGDDERLPVNGIVNAKGCAASEVPLPPRAAQLLEEGAVLALRFPHVDLPLQSVHGGNGLYLVLRPEGYPMPVR